jgi:hypothetical protein
MTSNRQIEANRGNAKRSTGPKTEAGKIRSSRNSLRHGLSRPTASGSDCEIRSMAHEGLTERPDLVRTKLELTRIRSARGALLAAFLKDSNPKLAKNLLGIDRYERKAFARQRRLLRRLRVARQVSRHGKGVAGRLAHKARIARSMDGPPIEHGPVRLFD